MTSCLLNSWMGEIPDVSIWKKGTDGENASVPIMKRHKELNNAVLSTYSVWRTPSQYSIILLGSFEIVSTCLFVKVVVTL